MAESSPRNERRWIPDDELGLVSLLQLTDDVSHQRCQGSQFKKKKKIWRGFRLKTTEKKEIISWVLFLFLLLYSWQWFSLLCLNLFEFFSCQYFGFLSSLRGQSLGLVVGSSFLWHTTLPLKPEPVYIVLFRRCCYAVFLAVSSHAEALGVHTCVPWHLPSAPACLEVRKWVSYDLAILFSNRPRGLWGPFFSAVPFLDYAHTWRLTEPVILLVLLKCRLDFIWN